jgi:hypothetical protein
MMNAKKHAYKNVASTGGMLAVALVISLTIVSLSRAYAAVAVANALVINRVTAAGGVSAGISIPVINQPVFIAASTIAPAGLRGTGVGAVTRHQVAGFANTISSAFVNAVGAPPATLATNSGALGTDFVYLTPGGVNASSGLEHGPTVNEIRVENDEGVATNTMVTMVW